MRNNVVYAFADDHVTLLGVAIAIPGNHYIVAINNANICDAKIETSEILYRLELKLIALVSQKTPKLYKDSNIESFYATPKPSLDNTQWPRPD